MTVDIRGRLVEERNFLLAMKEAGYLSPSSALAELVDNAIQAGARRISIEIRPHTELDLSAVTVKDDGEGMSPDTLDQCLRFGGSSRFNDRRGLGRFGMGLPTASLSLANVVTVTTWRVGMAPRAVALDALAATLGPSAPSVGTPATLSGTVVEWRGCPTLTRRSVPTIVRSVRSDLGRIFRRHISGGTSILLNGSIVPPLDPTFGSVVFDGACAHQTFENLEYRVLGPEGESPVRVRFFELPIEQWFMLDKPRKRTLGITGRAGCSVVRADREVAYGWYFFGKKRKENYDDWWRCEVEFDPALDEAFGITNTKQGIRPSEHLRHILEPDMESIARILNQRARESFEAAKLTTHALHASSIAHGVDPLLSPLPRTGPGPLSYRLRVEPGSGERFIRADVADGTLYTVLDSNHAVYKKVLAHLGELEAVGSEQVRLGVELSLLALGRSMAQCGGDQGPDGSLMETWSDTLTKFLRSL